MDFRLRFFGCSLLSELICPDGSEEYRIIEFTIRLVDWKTNYKFVFLARHELQIRAGDVGVARWRCGKVW